MTSVDRLLGEEKPMLFERILLLAGRFDPPGAHQSAIVKKLVGVRHEFLVREPDVPARILIWPVGHYVNTTPIAPGADRKEMIMRAFSCFAGVEFEWDDLNRNNYISTYEMHARLEFGIRAEIQAKFGLVRHMPGVMRDIRHVIAAEHVSDILKWEGGDDLWSKFRFLIMHRTGRVPEKMPPHASTRDVEFHDACLQLPELIASCGEWEPHVHPGVASYIKEHELYGHVAPTSPIIGPHNIRT